MEIARQIQQSMLSVAADGSLDGATRSPPCSGRLARSEAISTTSSSQTSAGSSSPSPTWPTRACRRAPEARVTALFRAIGPARRARWILRELDFVSRRGTTPACSSRRRAASSTARPGRSGTPAPATSRRSCGEPTARPWSWPGGGPALGLEANGPYPVWTGRFAPGDALVFCTDGVTEAFDVAGEAFGSERLRVSWLRPRRDCPSFSAGSAGGRRRAVRCRREVPAVRPGGARGAVHWSTDVVTGGVGLERRRSSVWGAPEDVARAQRRIEGILPARDVPAPTVHRILRAGDRGADGEHRDARVRGPAGPPGRRSRSGRSRRSIQHPIRGCFVAVQSPQAACAGG